MNKGDVVVLKSGSFPMTLEKNVNGTWYAVWWNPVKANFETHGFDPETLTTDATKLVTAYTNFQYILDKNGGPQIIIK